MPSCPWNCGKPAFPMPGFLAVKMKQLGMRGSHQSCELMLRWHPCLLQGAHLQ